MSKLKTALLSVGTVAVGVVTLRAVRKRRSNPRDEAKTAAEEALAESKAATDHAAAAAGHARVAGEKTIEYARGELKTVTANRKDTEATRPQPVGRLRRVGKGWIRR